MRAQECPHCDSTVAVASCGGCGREFALTVAHREGRLRAFDDDPLDPESALTAPLRCDVCEARVRGESLTTVVNAGMRQATCPSCRTMFLAT